MRLTKAQQESLKIKWQQSKLREHIKKGEHTPPEYQMFHEILDGHLRRLEYKSFLSFRRSVQGTFGCDGAVTIKWCNMWLCIEQDGYTHS
jgi:hypothetical protein